MREILLISQMRKLRLREVSPLVNGLPAWFWSLAITARLCSSPLGSITPPSSPSPPPRGAVTPIACQTWLPESSRGPVLSSGGARVRRLRLRRPWRSAHGHPGTGTSSQGCGRGTPSPAPALAPAPPALPPGQWGLSRADKGKRSKRRGFCSTREGGGRRRRGAGQGRPRAEPPGVYLFLSDTTQFDFPHKRSNNISVTVNYTPQKHIKGRSASAGPGLCAPRAPRFHARLRGVCGAGAPPSTPARASWTLGPLAGLPGWSCSQLMPGLPAKIVALAVASPQGPLSPRGETSSAPPPLPPQRAGKGARWAPLPSFVR